MSDEQPKTLGRIAFEARFDGDAGRSVPTWDQLPPHAQERWDHVAACIVATQADVPARPQLDDRLDATHVDFQCDDTGKIWLNIDGVCAVRVGHAQNVTIAAPGSHARLVYVDDEANRERAAANKASADGFDEQRRKLMSGGRFTGMGEGGEE